MDQIGINKDSVIRDLIEFSSKSMQWSIQESEKASVQVAQILDLLLKDAARMSEMSTSTIKAIENMRNEIDSVGSNSREGSDAGRATLLKQLHRVCKESKELTDLVQPIIEALQFQDRIRQVMENIGRIIRIWNESHQSMATKTDISEAEWLEIGKKFNSCTTMIEEREAVRAAIPQMPEEKKIEDMLLF